MSDTSKNETPAAPAPTGTSADTVNDETGKKLRKAEAHAAKLELELQDLTAKKAEQDKIIAELTKLPAPSGTPKKNLLDELCDFLGIQI